MYKHHPPPTRIRRIRMHGRHSYQSSSSLPTFDHIWRVSIRASAEREHASARSGSIAFNARLEFPGLRIITCTDYCSFETEESRFKQGLIMLSIVLEPMTLTLGCRMSPLPLEVAISKLKCKLDGGVTTTDAEFAGTLHVATVPHNSFPLQRNTAAISRSGNISTPTVLSRRKQAGRTVLRVYTRLSATASFLQT